MEPKTPLLSGILAAAIVVLVATSSWAQDPVFSQYAASPVYTNPALVGLYEGELRLTANFREQWPSVLAPEPLRTYAASAELRYNTSGRDYIGVAVNALQDQGGASRYTISRIGFGLAMQKHLAGGRGRNATTLGFGARVGYGQNSFDPTGLWFSSQYDSLSSTINSDGASPLPAGFVTETLGYLDISTGVNFAVVREDYSILVGAAAHHVNTPNTSFLFDANENLAARFSGIVGGEYLIERNLRIMPSVLFERQGQLNRLTAGGALYYRSENAGDGDAGFRMGLYGRSANDFTDNSLNFEAIILAAQLEYRDLTVGLSYDINAGHLGRTTDGRGAFEISLSYIREGRTRGKVVCPKL